ncbi:metal ABC transporter substrate-binding protein [Tuwongella immobilis]|uniref:ABC transporter substrate-binding protein n=1 Tax=Tuwongella immobilis TaxID=692036 RepID=A0A6C2YRQ1_9BACT|nr:metal ABC transporter substrate-binding protein [Tuwongella immobilis]VIP04340.1 abc transporter substrate-binding protein : Periplasmic solute binding protein OS=Anabaena variabilis (strain ATCC 29413 / PCC 7937) GN=Ava_B0224 PE=3 SV=1: TroA [Tuwongella immobilis]VTS06042.1 abc transporter substrate-binding protein : Periplasmic solute binding protein OS=Anabaena variabilis (strain ATCC 29413 / PCC 7937) GN=Ava_B0224 PE=3 SV=1: TroA [Tuwongella immobilis]
MRGASWHGSRRIGTRIRLTLLGFVALLGMTLTGCAPGPVNPWPEKPGPKVLVTFAPLYSFVSSVAGDDANVMCLLTNHGPHGFEPTKREAQIVATSEVVIMNGLGLDDAIIAKLSRARGGKLKVYSLGDSLDKNTLHANEEHDHDHGHDHDHAGHDHHHHDHGAYDPHIWLGSDESVAMISAIEKALSEMDPAHAAGYKARAAETIAKLKALHAEGKELLKGKSEKAIVSFHDSLRYLASSYGLQIAGVVQVDAGVEPNSAAMKRLIATCVKEKVRLIAVEPQFPANNAAKTILEALKSAGVADAGFIEIDPLETASPEDLKPDWYFEKMRQNLQQLAKALK